MRPTAAALFLAAIAVTALVADRLWAAGAIAAALLALTLRAGRHIIVSAVSARDRIGPG